MGRPPKPPPHKRGEYYPAEAASDVAELVPYLRTVHKSLGEAITAATNQEVDDIERTRALLGALGSARSDFETYIRVVAEYAMKDQKFTTQETALAMGGAETGFSRSNMTRWRLDPVSMPRPLGGN